MKNRATVKSGVRLHESGGLTAADFPLVNSIDKLHAGDDVGELAEAA